MSVTYFPSQIGELSQTPLPYTSDPRQQLMADIYLAFAKYSFVAGIFWPFRFGSKADPFDELYPSWVNIKAVILHSILVVVQSAFFISLPFFIVFPLFWLLIYVALFWLFNSAVCLVLNGSELKLESNGLLVDSKHESEYWIFLNGVSVGRDWLQSNIDRLSLTFGRKIYGVHNPTGGIILDLIQCLIQRNFQYTTQDIRAVYGAVRDALYDEDIKKVVLILHSQGGIEGGLVIDWLLDVVPQHLLRKLEVYTFGNAANHFNNPQRGDRAALNNPLAKSSKPEDNLKAIGHIEHYANQGDFVSQIGVLYYAKTENRFMGRIFLSPFSGHLLNQHYLHEMFPLEFDKKCKNTNDFMEMNVDMSQVGVHGGEREGWGPSMPTDGDVTFIGDLNSPISPLHLSTPDSPLNGRIAPLKVKNFSRLWLYRNGESPPDDLIRRAATT